LTVLSLLFFSLFLQFQEDINLICTNCFLYNRPDTVYYKAATRLQSAANLELEVAKKRLANSPIDPETGFLTLNISDSIFSYDASKDNDSHGEPPKKNDNNKVVTPSKENSKQRRTRIHYEPSNSVKEISITPRSKRRRMIDQEGDKEDDNRQIGTFEASTPDLSVERRRTRGNRNTRSTAMNVISPSGKSHRSNHHGKYNEMDIHDSINSLKKEKSPQSQQNEKGRRNTSKGMSFFDDADDEKDMVLQSSIQDLNGGIHRRVCMSL